MDITEAFKLKIRKKQSLFVEKYRISYKIGSDEDFVAKVVDEVNWEATTNFLEKLFIIDESKELQQVNQWVYEETGAAKIMLYEFILMNQRMAECKNEILLEIDEKEIAEKLLQEL